MKARWLLLSIFPIGYLMTKSFYSDDWFYYYFLNILSLLSMILFLLKLRNFNPELIFAWIILMVFLLGYFFKFYLLSYMVYLNISDLNMKLFFGLFVPKVVDKSILLECFKVVVFSFATSAVVFCFLLNNNRKRSNLSILYLSNPYLGIISIRLILLAIFLWLITSFLRWYFKLGVPGKAAVLPFKLAGFIYIVNSMVVPSLLGIAFLYSVISRINKYRRLTLYLFILWGVVQFLLFPSKFFLILPLLWIVLVSVLMHQIVLKRKFIISFFILFIIIYPFLNFYRFLLYSETKISLHLIIEAIQKGFEVNDINGLLSLFFVGLSFLSSRVVGFDSLLLITALRPIWENQNFWQYILSDQSAGRFLTRALGFEEGTMGVGASLLGQAYYATGNYFMTAIWIAAWSLSGYVVSRVLLKFKNPLFYGFWIIWIINAIQWSSGELSWHKVNLLFVNIICVWLITKTAHCLRIYGQIT